MVYPRTPRELILKRLLFAASITTWLGTAATLILTGLLQAPLSWAQRAIRLRLHRARRWQTAKGLHALRHDREYLLGHLPPVVSNQVLSYLDRAAVSALRCASRQAFLLVGSGCHRLRLGLQGLVHYTAVPLPAAYPRLQVLELDLSRVPDDLQLWLRPLNTTSAKRAGQPAQLPGTGRPLSWMRSGAALDPSLTSHVADAILHAFLLHGNAGRSGTESEPPPSRSDPLCQQEAAAAAAVGEPVLGPSSACSLPPSLTVLDMRGCSASFSHHTWRLLAQALPSGCMVAAPTRALQDVGRCAYSAAPASVEEVVPALRHLQSLAASRAHRQEVMRQQHQHLQQHQSNSQGAVLPPAPADALSLDLSGAGISITSPAALHTLVTASAAYITRLPLLDMHPSAGTLPWSHLTALTRLTHLAVVTGRTASLDKLLATLPELPSLKSLSLGCPSHSSAPPVPAGMPSDLRLPRAGESPVERSQLAAMQEAAQLEALELDTLVLTGILRPPRPAAAPGPEAEMHAFPFPGVPPAQQQQQQQQYQPQQLAAGITGDKPPVLPNIRSLAVTHLLSDPSYPQLLPAIFPALTSLALGTCPDTRECSQHGLTPSEAGAAQRAQRSETGLLVAAMRPSMPRRVASLPLGLAAHTSLISLTIHGWAAAQLAAEVQAAPGAPGGPCGLLPVSLRSLHLGQVESYPELVTLVTAAAATCSHLTSITLAHCCEGSASVLQAVLPVGGDGTGGEAGRTVTAAGAGASGAAGIMIGAQSVVSVMAADMGSLQDLALTGGDFQLVQQVMLAPGVATHLTIADCDMLMASDIAEALGVHVEEEPSPTGADSSSSTSSQPRRLRVLRLQGCKGLDSVEAEWEAVRQRATGIDVLCVPHGAG